MLTSILTGARQRMARHRIQQALQRVSHPCRSRLLSRRFSSVSILMYRWRCMGRYGKSRSWVFTWVFLTAVNLFAWVEGVKTTHIFGDFQSDGAGLLVHIFFRIPGFTQLKTKACPKILACLIPSPCNRGGHVNWRLRCVCARPVRGGSLHTPAACATLGRRPYAVAKRLVRRVCKREALEVSHQPDGSMEGGGGVSRRV